jgi:hypothetical protein
MIAVEGRKEDSLIALADLIQRLTKGWTDHIPVIVLGRVITRTITYPGLLEQLEAALYESTPTDTSSRSIPDSTPPVPEPPFDVLLAFHAFQHTAPKPLTQLVGWASTAPHPTAAALVVELWALTRRAEIVLGHRYAPRSIEGACPACDATRSLRVNMTDHGPIDAYCTKCDAVWDTPDLGILARMLEVR